MPEAGPKRRRTTHVEALHGELCIYEWTTKTVHALNPAAARVWELCDGSTTVEEMIAAIGNAPAAELIVRHALAQFERAGLLEQGSLSGLAPVISRRAVLRRIGVAAAVPVVTSMVIPRPLDAASSVNCSRSLGMSGSVAPSRNCSVCATLAVVVEFGVQVGHEQGILGGEPGDDGGGGPRKGHLDRDHVIGERGWRGHERTSRVSGLGPAQRIRQA